MHKVRGPSFSKDIFKAYDIRGVYPEEINEDAAYKIARAFAGYLRIGKKDKKLLIALSHDARNSSASLKKAFIEGLLNEGVEVVDAGLTTTPMHYFIVNKTNADGGAMITASHNPKEFNGIKLSKKEAMPIGEGSGMEEIKNASIRGLFSHGERGTLREENFLEDYTNFFEESFPDLKSYPVKIKIDNGEAFIYKSLKNLFKKFPKFKISPKNYDIEVSFDADGDRIGFKDERGAHISGDIIAALLARKLGRQGETIIYDVRESKVLLEEIDKCGAKAIQTRVGHVFIKKLMREKNAIFGAELSGHYYFRDFFFADSSIFAMLSVIDLMRIENKSLSQLIEPLMRYAKSPEINFQLQDKEKIIDKIAAYFGSLPAGRQAPKISYLDGISVEYPDFWFNLRPSNTENLLRLNIEANTQELLEEKNKLLSELIND